MITRTKTTKEVCKELSGQDILALLVETKKIKIETDSTFSVKFLVPSGGDYSGMDLNISEDDPIFITYKSSE